MGIFTFSLNQDTHSHCGGLLFLLLEYQHNYILCYCFADRCLQILSLTSLHSFSKTHFVRLCKIDFFLCELCEVGQTISDSSLLSK